MNEIITFLRYESQNPRRRRMRNNVVFVVCGNMGTIYSISSNGQVVRKANVVGNRDNRIAYFNALRMFNEMDENVLNRVTVKIRNNVNVILMYCHRPSQSVDKSCQKILLFGSCCIIFRNITNDLNNFTLKSNGTSSTNQLESIIPDLLHKTYDLQNNDELELVDNGPYFIRVSSNKHCIYIDPDIFSKSVRYKSVNNNSAITTIK